MIHFYSFKQFLIEVEVELVSGKRDRGEWLSNHHGKWGEQRAASWQFVWLLVKAAVSVCVFTCVCVCV